LQYDPSTLKRRIQEIVDNFENILNKYRHTIKKLEVDVEDVIGPHRELPNSLGEMKKGLSRLDVKKPKEILDRIDYNSKRLTKLQMILHGTRYLIDKALHERGLIYTSDFVERLEDKREGQ